MVFLIALSTLLAAATPRVVSLSPAVTEIIFAIGAGDHLVGNTIYCNYPEEAKRIRKVGDLISPKLELIKSLNPDIVFITLPMQKHIKDQLEALNIRVIDVSPESIEGIYESILKVGKLLDKESRAESLVQSLRAEVESLSETRGKWIPRCYIELSSGPLYTAGGKSFINELLEIAGGRNIFADVEKSYFVVSPERIIKRNPDVIILLYPEADPNEVRTRVGFENITAVKNGWIISDLDQDILTRPGPRFVLGIKSLRKALFGLLNSRGSNPESAQ